MYILFVFLSQLISNSPPFNKTFTSLFIKLFDTPATTAAQLPVPQAKVSPYPRSHTLIFIKLFSNISTNSTFVF